MILRIICQTFLILHISQSSMLASATLLRSWKYFTILCSPPSQASPVRPSGTTSTEMKTLRQKYRQVNAKVFAVNPCPSITFSTTKLILNIQGWKPALCVNTLRTGLLNCLNARSRGLTLRHRASCI